MTRITTTEHVLMLLRAHLERARRAGRKRTQTRQGKPGPLQRVQQLASVESLSEADVARALIAGLLAEELGPEIAAEARFQVLVEDVRQIIDRDDAGRALLKSAIVQLTK